MSNKLTVGLVGWRGMVGSVLMNRMLEKAILSISRLYFFQPVTQVATPLILAVKLPMLAR